MDLLVDLQRNFQESFARKQCQGSLETTKLCCFLVELSQHVSDTVAAVVCVCLSSKQWITIIPYEKKRGVAKTRESPLFLAKNGRLQLLVQMDVLLQSLTVIKSKPRVPSSNPTLNPPGP